MEFFILLLLITDFYGKINFDQFLFIFQFFQPDEILSKYYINIFQNNFQLFKSFAKHESRTKANLAPVWELSFFHIIHFLIVGMGPIFAKTNISTTIANSNIYHIMIVVTFALQHQTNLKFRRGHSCHLAFPQHLTNLKVTVMFNNYCMSRIQGPSQTVKK